MNVDNLKRNIVSIEYPGRVVNDREAIRTMGGLETMSQVHSNENRKIELRFRPDDPYCKPTHGERHAMSNMLIKVVKKVRRNKVTKEEEVSYHTELAGVVNKTYKFQGLCDFQYLPMAPNPKPTAENPDKFVSILEQVLPQKLESLSWVDDPGPVFMSPPVFSRMDTPMDYVFKKDPVGRSNNKSGQYSSNVIGRMRKKRTMQTIFMDFTSPAVPTKPREMAVRNLKVRFVQQDDIDKIKKLFDERPIWTKAALSHIASTVQRSSLNLILAVTAFIFKNGPWRNAWVRIGYDPRHDPIARNYQILDYRINQSFKNKVLPKRSYSKYHQPHKYVSAMRSKTSTLRQTADASASNAKDSKPATDESSYIYRPGVTPLCRQMFYQYCDLRVPEIEELLATSPVLPVCDERYGWYPGTVEEECRKILNKYMGEAFAQLRLKRKEARVAEGEEDARRKRDEEDDDDDDSGEDDGVRDNNLQSSEDEDEESIPDEDEEEFPDEDDEDEEEASATVKGKTKA